MMEESPDGRMGAVALPKKLSRDRKARGCAQPPGIQVRKDYQNVRSPDVEDDQLGRYGRHRIRLRQNVDG